MNDIALHFPVDSLAAVRAAEAFDYALLNGFQRSFPLTERPYADIAGRLGVGEKDVLDAYSRLAAAGAVSRIGAVFRPGAVGAGALVAMRVPANELEAVAELISAHPEVSHNYERDHAFNLWFVATAADQAALGALLETIRAATGREVLPLPLLEEYHLDLGFDLNGAAGAPRQDIGGPRRPTPAALDARERRLVAALQDGLAIAPAPYAQLGLRARMRENEVIDALARWIEAGVVRRLGVIVRHRELGYRANAMIVWDVPDTLVAEAGLRLAKEPRVTLAYRRARHAPQWRYNLYCMVHGRERAEVEHAAAAVARAAGLENYPHAMLFSLRRFKQKGARSMRAAREGE